ncbi:acyltransferase family protein [Macrococcoides caseolyticum]|uniref:acyltransferase family protein n=1 Tax=Macrococcoides caseolyticum TaxID=69966 RepID=UPI001F3CDA41|nr:acyltransferase family protein [Macrococcus caseolyticus]MCE4956533.1 acetyltransferase [Macrococcus caseolyticus]
MNKQYFPGLDGMRAIAVIAIIIFHLNPKWLPGGFLGVDTFFIISGYLITTLLIKEYETNGSINLLHFWYKRIKRLLPPVLFMMFIVIQYIIFFDRELLYQVKKDMFAALVYVSNWWYIFDGLDYFQSLEPRPLKHLWSLAIEEQFYLLFPFVLLLLFKYLKKKSNILLLFFFISIVSMAIMWMMFDPAKSISRIYFGTDTRLQTLLLGAMLALIWPAYKLKNNPPQWMVWSIDIIGLAGCIFLIRSFFVFTEHSASVFQGGLYFLGLFTLFFIMAIVHPDTILSKVLSIPVLTWIGRYSYSLYLWHYPIIVLMQSHFIQGQIPWYVHLLSLILTVIMAIISYQLIEQPFRRRGLKAFIDVKTAKQFATILMSLYLLLSTPFLLKTVKAEAPANENKIVVTQTKSIAPALKQISPIDAPDDIQQEGQTKSYPYAPLFIGDSVLVDINFEIKKVFPNATIDGEVGRSIYKAIPVADNYPEFNRKDGIVVLYLGTNGDFQDIHMETILKKFDKAQVFLVTARVPRDYEAHVNEEMHRFSKKYKNVHIIDWYKESQGHPEYFAPDGIHLEYPGVLAMNKIVTEEILKVVDK